MEVCEAVDVNFSSEDARRPSHPHHDTLVIVVLIVNCLVKRTLVDNGSLTNLLFLHALMEMKILEAQIVRKVTTLIGFIGEQQQSMGEMNLTIYYKGLNLHQKFQVIDDPSTYNVILGRPWVHKIKAIPSTYH